MIRFEISLWLYRLEKLPGLSRNELLQTFKSMPCFRPVLHLFSLVHTDVKGIAKSFFFNGVMKKELLKKTNKPNARLQCKTISNFETKIAQIDTPFLTKTAEEKPI